MTGERTVQIVTGASIALLLFVSVVANGTIVAVVAGVLAVAGLVALPRLRKRGSLSLLNGDQWLPWSRLPPVHCADAAW